MKRLITLLLGGRLQLVLIASFALVAALTVSLGTLVTSRLINDYLVQAETERVARDMNLAQAFYQLKLNEVAAISHRLVLDSWVVDNLAAAVQQEPDALHIIDQQITNKIAVLALGGTHLIVVLDAEGRVVAGRALSPDSVLSPFLGQGDWSALPILQAALATGVEQAATEVLPAELLAQVGLNEQARVPLIETPKAAPELFDPREGTGGLALVGVAPLKDDNGRIQGAVLAAYMFNNDYTLVDHIRAVAGVDTVTIFFGDLRVSTNVMTAEGDRAVGTRVSQEVYDVVLSLGRDYVGRAFVVNDWFITRYEPVRDYRGQVVGSLYVGARESTFRELVDAFNNRVILIVLVCVILAGVIAVPISRRITRPIGELVEANRRLAQGDMSVRVRPSGSIELTMLGGSFNRMVEKLQETQHLLLHKERLASMGQLSAGVAHEINNPLGTILLFADVLHKETAETDPRREDLQLIKDEAMRCKKIVADLLNFARQQEVLAQETNINNLLEQLLGVIMHEPVFSRVRIVRQFAADLPLIQADPAQLQQVFSNLIRNAAEAMPEGGTITLTTRAQPEQKVAISVADTGSGVSADNLGKIFSPFFTTKPVGKGTGLGLSIAYGIIKMHQGQISVHSAGEKGTTFTVVLPVRLAGTQTAINESE
jgi:two-component system, NtrC family, sensor kinase